MNFYSHYSFQNLPYNCKINISKIKSILLEELHTRYIIGSGIMSGNVFVDLLYRGGNLFFYIRTVSDSTIHKKYLEHRSINPILLGDVSCPFFRGYNPLRNEDYEGDIF